MYIVLYGRKSWFHCFVENYHHYSKYQSQSTSFEYFKIWKCSVSPYWAMAVLLLSFWQIFCESLGWLCLKQSQQHYCLKSATSHITTVILRMKLIDWVCLDHVFFFSYYVFSICKRQVSLQRKDLSWLRVWK